MLNVAPLFANADTNTEQAFNQSQGWKDYSTAFDSWEKAMWSLIDSYVIPGNEEIWRAKLPEHYRYDNAADEELVLQGYLARRAFFLHGLKKEQKEGNAAWFKSYGRDFGIAQSLDDDGIFEELARLCRRKTSQDVKGRRSLRFLLILHWIPGCFWAITNAGMIDFLCRENPQLCYSEGRIRNVISELQLWRPDKPLYWGIDSSGQPSPLR